MSEEEERAVKIALLAAAAVGVLMGISITLVIAIMTGALS